MIKPFRAFAKRRDLILSATLRKGDGSLRVTGALDSVVGQVGATCTRPRLPVKCVPLVERTMRENTRRLANIRSDATPAPVRSI